MSASDMDSSIYFSDTDNQIKKKIGRAFSGGQETKELHEKLGGRTAVDMAFQFLTFFLEDDDRLEEIRQAYEKGTMSSGEMKTIATQQLQAYVTAFRERRKAVSPEIRARFLTPRQLVFRGMPNAKDRLNSLESRKKLLEEELAMIQEEMSSVHKELDEK